MVCESETGIEPISCNYNAIFQSMRLRRFALIANNNRRILRECSWCAHWFKRFWVWLRSEHWVYNDSKWSSERCHWGPWCMPEWRVQSSVSSSLNGYDFKLVCFQALLLKIGSDSCSWRARFWPRSFGYRCEDDVTSFCLHFWTLASKVGNIPMEFGYREDTFDFLGAVCFCPSSQGRKGVGHYTAVCQRDGNLALYNDSTVSFEVSQINYWLGKSRLLVYSS